MNFKPSLGPGVTVADTELTGFAWGENIGWINLNPTGGGVLNNGQGTLAGYAWSENVGWISFSCSNTNVCATKNYGVTIDPNTGEFSAAPGVKTPAGSPSEDSYGVAQGGARPFSRH